MKKNKYFKNIFTARFILFNLVNQDLKSRYRQSLLGIGWSLATPLGLVTIIGFVFSTVLGQPIKEFIPFLFSGLMPWLFIVQSAEGGTGAFISAEGYLKQTNTPMEIFPLRNTMGAMVQLCNSLIAFFLVYLFLAIEKFNYNMLLVPLSLIIFFMLGVALSNLSALVNTFYRDYGHIQSLFFQGLFYATPIMFPANLLKGKAFEWIYKYNPFYYMIEIIRNPLLGKGTPHLYYWFIAAGFAFVLYVISILLLNKVGRRIVYKL